MFINSHSIPSPIVHFFNGSGWIHLHFKKLALNLLLFFFFTNLLKLHVPVIQDYKNLQKLLVRYKISPFYWYMGKPNARDQNAFFNPFDSVSDNSRYKCEQENIIAQF